MRQATPAALEFTKHFFREGKPVAAICHGLWVLIDAGVVRGRKLTFWPAIQTDVKHAGGNWVDEEVVVDNGLLTSRKTDDIPALNRKMIEEISEWVTRNRRRARRSCFGEQRAKRPRSAMVPRLPVCEKLSLSRMRAGIPTST